MTCNNCIHLDVCKGFGITSGKYEREICAGFSRKFDYAHLPCKAGDTIFMPWEWNGENGIAIITVLRVVLTECESYIETDFDSDDYDYFMKYNCGRFWFEDFEKIVFTTKEEAEKMLAERSRK